jgi:hypothetical protein
MTSFSGALRVRAVIDRSHQSLNRIGVTPPNLHLGFDS